MRSQELKDKRRSARCYPRLGNAKHIAESDLGIDDQRDLSKPRAKALADESICTIVFPAQGNIPSRPIRIVRPRKKSNSIEVELSADVIDYFVGLIHHEMLKHPKEVVMNSESTDRDDSSDEIVDDD